MREIKFFAGLGTILVIGGIYCFKALPKRKVSSEEFAERGNTVTKNSNKILLIIAGIVLIVGGLLILGMSFKKLL